MFDRIEIVRVPDPQYVPVIALEARGHVLRECKTRWAFDRDVVVVVNPAEVVEAEMACQGRSLRCHAFHQTAIAANHVHVVVEEIEARLVIATGEPLAGDRHADTGRHALPQWPRGGLDAGNPMVLGMAGCLAVQLTE